jgi:hypothetical protein
LQLSLYSCVVGAGSFSNTGNMCTAPKPTNPTGAKPIPDRRSLGTSKTFTPDIKIIVLELLTSTRFDHVALGPRALIEVGSNLWDNASGSIPVKPPSAVTAQGYDSRDPTSLAVKSKDFRNKRALARNEITKIGTCKVT